MRISLILNHNLLKVKSEGDFNLKRENFKNLYANKMQIKKGATKLIVTP